MNKSLSVPNLVFLVQSNEKHDGKQQQQYQWEKGGKGVIWCEIVTIQLLHNLNIFVTEFEYFVIPLKFSDSNCTLLCTAKMLHNQKLPI